jgi:arylsulfatase A
MNRRIGGSATPLRGFKFSKWEGGMRVPCIIRWPGTIPAGKTCDEIAATIDLLPTLAAFSGSQLPPLPIDGLSIAALLTDEAGAKSPHSAYFYRTNGVRSGKWKFIDGQLFDLEADIAESNDVSETYPEKVTELEALLAQHKADMKAHGREPARHTD